MNDPGTGPVDPEKRDAPASSLSSEFESALPSTSAMVESGSAPPPLETAAGDKPVATDPTAPPSKQEKYWAAGVHGAGGVGLLSNFASIPFLNVIIPLVIWLIKKDEMPFVRSQGKEVLNFQISWTLYGLAAGLVIGAIGFVLTIVFVGIFILWGLAILGGIYVVVMTVLSIIGTINAADGKSHKYPATIQFIK